MIIEGEITFYGKMTFAYAIPFKKKSARYYLYWLNKHPVSWIHFTSKMIIEGEITFYGKMTFAYAIPFKKKSARYYLYWSSIWSTMAMKQIILLITALLFFAEKGKSVSSKQWIDF